MLDLGIGVVEALHAPQNAKAKAEPKLKADAYPDAWQDGHSAQVCGQES